MEAHHQFVVGRRGSGAAVWLDWLAEEGKLMWLFLRAGD